MTSHTFAEAFEARGSFLYCAEAEMQQQLSLLIKQRMESNICKETLLREKLAHLQFPGFSQEPLDKAEVALTGCEMLIARTGSIVMSTAQESGRTTSVYAPVHICLANTSQLVYDIKDGLQLLKQRYAGRMPSLITFATAQPDSDIEKTWLLGCGLKVFVFLTEN